MNLTHHLGPQLPHLVLYVKFQFVVNMLTFKIMCLFSMAIDMIFQYLVATGACLTLCNKSEELIYVGSMQCFQLFSVTV